MTLATSSLAAAPSPDGEVGKSLAGLQSRTWVLHDVVYLRSGADCIRGEVYTFFADRRLKVTRCLDGQIAESIHQWRLISQDELETVLQIDGTKFLLSFKRDGQRTQMRLRARAAGKDGKTEDRLFRLK